MDIQYAAIGRKGRPSRWKALLLGLSDTLDLMGAADVPPPTPQLVRLRLRSVLGHDHEALASDWQAVGQDMRLGLLAAKGERIGKPLKQRARTSHSKHAVKRYWAIQRAHGWPKP